MTVAGLLGILGVDGASNFLEVDWRPNIGSQGRKE